MPNSLRTAALHIASGLPKGDPTRRDILTAVKEAAGLEPVLSPGTPPAVKRFLLEMERAFKKHFPKGYYRATASKKFGHNSIYIVCATLPKGQQANGIIENDPSYNTFHMFDSYDNEGMTPRIKIEMSQGDRLWGPNSTNPQKVGWRNGTAKPAGLVKKFDVYFGRLAKMVAASAV